MLHALLRNKLRRARLAPDEADGAEQMAWEKITDHEDALTSAVFERLAYLDTTTLWEVLREACDGALAAVFPKEAPAGSPAWRFWPRLGVGEGGGHAHTVEPDLLVVWDDAVLVVEAKHCGAQDAWQWSEEIRAVRSRYAGRAVWFIAAGGTNQEQRDVIAVETRRDLGGDAPPIFWLRWERLRSVVDRSGASAALRDIAAALDKWRYRLPQDRLRFDTLPPIADALRFNVAALDLSSWRIR
jgi:hypothetical protein